MLSRSAIHAVRAVVALAERPDEFQGAAAIAERIGAPQNYLGKLLRSLAQEGVLHSQKGLGGGFQLLRSPDEITLFEVVDPIDHVSRWSGCFFGNPTCNPKNPCPMHERWAKVRGEYLKMLQDITIAEILEGMHIPA